MIRQIAANAKGFTQAANELPGTVSNGDVAAAMSIDFYARSQIAAVGGGRVGYVEPQGATMVTPEPIAVAKGAQQQRNGVLASLGLIADNDTVKLGAMLPLVSD